MKNRSAGFTAIELIVVIALVGFFATISAPIFSEYFDSSRLKYSQQILETTLGQAFSYARSHPETVTVSGVENSRKLSIVYEGGNSRFQELERGVTLDSDFFITFLPPYGDIDLDGILPPTEIELNGKNYSTKTEIHRASGLIETFQNGN